jgi:hypothetical protein
VTAVKKSKHPGHFRILEKINLDSLQTGRNMVNLCLDSIQRSRELIEQSRAAISRAQSARTARRREM